MPKDFDATDFLDDDATTQLEEVVVTSAQVRTMLLASQLVTDSQLHLVAILTVCLAQTLYHCDKGSGRQPTPPAERDQMLEYCVKTIRDLWTAHDLQRDKTDKTVN